MCPSSPCRRRLLYQSMYSTLNSAVGVVRQPGQVRALVLTTPDRHLQRVQRQIRIQRRSDLPPDDHPGEHVQHERRIHPPLRGADKGQVRDPQLVRPRRGEVPLDQVTRPPGLRRGPGRARRLVAQQPAQPLLAHQPLDRAPRHPGALLARLPGELPVQLVPDLPDPVDAVVLLVDLLDLLAQHPIPGRAGRGGGGSCGRSRSTARSVPASPGGPAGPAGRRG